jgi:chromosome segregation ATPase
MERNTTSSEQPRVVEGSALKQSIRASAEQTSALEAERRALEDARDQLAAEEEDLRRRSAALREERSALQQRADSLRQQLDEVEESIDGCGQELTAMELRRTEHDARLRQLGRAGDELEAELTRYRRELSAAGTVLELGQDSLSRLVHRLALREMKG